MRPGKKSNASPYHVKNNAGISQYTIGWNGLSSYLSPQVYRTVLGSDKEPRLIYEHALINTYKYHVFAPMVKFQLELIYLYFPPSFHQTVVVSVLSCPDLNSNCQLPKPGDRSNFNTHKTC